MSSFFSGSPANTANNLSDNYGNYHSGGSNKTSNSFNSGGGFNFGDVNQVARDYDSNRWNEVNQFGSQPFTSSLPDLSTGGGGGFFDFESSSLWDRLGSTLKGGATGLVLGGPIGGVLGGLGGFSFPEFNNMFNNSGFMRDLKNGWDSWDGFGIPSQLPGASADSWTQFWSEAFGVDPSSITFDYSMDHSSDRQFDAPTRARMEQALNGLTLGSTPHGVRFTGMDLPQDIQWALSQTQGSGAGIGPFNFQASEVTRPDNRFAAPTFDKDPRLPWLDDVLGAAFGGFNQGFGAQDVRQQEFDRINRAATGLHENAASQMRQLQDMIAAYQNAGMNAEQVTQQRFNRLHDAAGNFEQWMAQMESQLDSQASAYEQQIKSQITALEANIQQMESQLGERRGQYDERVAAAEAQLAEMYQGLADEYEQKYGNMDERAQALQERSDLLRTAVTNQQDRNATNDQLMRQWSFDDMQRRDGATNLAAYQRTGMTEFEKVKSKTGGMTWENGEWVFTPAEQVYKTPYGNLTERQYVEALQKDIKNFNATASAFEKDAAAAKAFQGQAQGTLDDARSRTESDLRDLIEAITGQTQAFQQTVDQGRAGIEAQKQQAQMAMLQMSQQAEMQRQQREYDLRGQQTDFDDLVAAFQSQLGGLHSQLGDRFSTTQQQLMAEAEQLINMRNESLSRISESEKQELESRLQELLPMLASGNRTQWQPIPTQFDDVFSQRRFR
jgi:hypothetical protein